MMDLSTLNENQSKAVQWKDSPLLVLAGPGSGKTKVLTTRIAQILKESTGKHFRILALTFTNKAAAEMRGRVEKLVPNDFSRVRLTTFHSYAVELLQQHGSHLGIRPDFQILSDNADREALLEDVLLELKKDFTNPIPEHFGNSKLLPLINKMLEHCIPVEKAEAILSQAKVENAASFADVYKAYKEALLKANALDFPSLIAKALELFEKHPFLAKHIRKVFKHILVDEFQDTNQSQYRLLSYITQPDPSTLFVVADDDQIMYQWNGASPERIESLRREFTVEEIQLPENYRCPSAVIEIANALIANNINRTANKEPLIAKKNGGNGKNIRVVNFEDLDTEAAWIANDILNRSAEEQAKCAVLARTNKVLEVASKYLKDAGLAVYSAMRKSEFKSAPLRMLHAILKLTNSKEDKQSLARLSKAFYELEGVTIDLSNVLSRVTADDKDILNSWLEEVLLRHDVEDHTFKLLRTDIKPLINSLNYKVFTQSFFDWVEICQGTSRPEENAFNEFEDERKVWNLFLAEISKKFEGENIGLHQFLHELELSSKAPPKPPNAIPCFSIHASKGMEFGHVYLMGLVEDQLPIWSAVKKGSNSFEMQEERRNCFVAITRAEESLTLTYSSEVFGWKKQPSRFLKEMGFEV